MDLTDLETPALVLDQRSSIATSRECAST